MPRSQLFIAVVAAAVLFVGYILFSRWFKSSEGYEEYAAAPIVTQPIPEPPRTVAPGGPNSPNQAPPTSMPAVRLPGPEDSDPYEDTYGSSDMKDNMRYPERLFGPAVTPDDTELPVESGVASPRNAKVSQALQTFSPDFAQNGGEFIKGGIFANDTFEVPNYSAI